MPRPKTILQSDFPYFISIRRPNKEWFPIPMDEVWKLFSNHLFFLHHAYKFRIHAAVLMSNHYHSIVTTPLANISEGLGHFHRELSKDINRVAGRVNQNFGRPYYPCVLEGHYHYLNAYKYLYRNPIVAGLANEVEEYKYSTLHGLLGFSHLTIPVAKDTLLFNPELDDKHLLWLNQGKFEDYLEIKAALRKNKFQYCKNDDTGKPQRDDDFVF